MAVAGIKTKKQSSKAQNTKNTIECPIFDAAVVLDRVKKDIKSLKIEAKTIHTRVQEEKTELEKEKAAFEQSNSKASQMEAIKGKELFKLARLKHMGFTEDVIKEHLEKENKTLQRISVEKRKERTNLQKNIEHMKNMNEQSEKAVITAEADVRDKITRAKKLKDELDEAELKVYALENKVKHSRRTKGIDIMSKDPLRDGIKDIVDEVTERSTDRNLVTKVLKVAGRCLAVDDMQTSWSHNSGAAEDSDSGDSVEISDASSDEDP
jgi:chromosome segregation ATPase